MKEGDHEEGGGSGGLAILGASPHIIESAGRGGFPHVQRQESLSKQRHEERRMEGGERSVLYAGRWARSVGEVTGHICYLHVNCVYLAGA